MHLKIHGENGKSVKLRIGPLWRESTDEPVNGGLFHIAPAMRKRFHVTFLKCLDVNNLRVVS